MCSKHQNAQIVAKTWETLRKSMISMAKQRLKLICFYEFVDYRQHMAHVYIIDPSLSIILNRRIKSY